MVTLRRDVAAMQENHIFDRMDRDQGQITDYDRFMQEKNKSENFAYIYSKDYFSSTEEISSAKNIELADKTKVVKPIKVKNNDTIYQDYNEYMMSQINRIVPGKILSEEEFNYSLTKGKNRGIITKRQKEENTEKLSKRAKIIICLYISVLIGAAILFFFI